MVTITNFREEQYPATDETQCVKIYIPAGDEYKQLLAGLLALPARVANFQDPDSVQAEGVATIWQDAYDLTDWEGCGTPPACMHTDSEITIFPGNMDVVSGNPISNAVNTGARGNMTSQQLPNANGNSRRTFRYMAAGDWAYRLTASTVSTGCALQITIVDADGTNHILTSINLRSAATTLNVVFSGTFTLNESGKTQIF